MKFTKVLAVVVALLFVVLMIATFGTRFQATLTDVSVAPASSRTEEFLELLAAVDRGDLADSQYRAVDSYNPDNYVFITYTVALSSFNVLPGEWCILNLSPLADDVALVRGAIGQTPPMGGCTITATLLTTVEAAQSPRNLWAEYYILGRLHSVTVSDAARPA